MKNRGGKIFLSIALLASAGLFSLWLLGRFSGAGTLVFAPNKGQTLGLAGITELSLSENSVQAPSKVSQSNSKTVAEELLQNIWALKQAGINDEESFNKLIDHLSNIGQGAPLVFTPFTKESQKITNDTKETVRYASSLIKILKDDSFNKLGDEIEIWIRNPKVEGKDRDKITSACSSYKNTGNKLLALLVPAKAADKHLVLVNAFLGMSVACDRLREEYDIVAGFPAIKLYYESVFSLESIRNQ